MLAGLDYAWLLMFQWVLMPKRMPLQGSHEHSASLLPTKIHGRHLIGSCRLVCILTHDTWVLRLLKQGSANAGLVCCFKQRVLPKMKILSEIAKIVQETFLISSEVSLVTYPVILPKSNVCFPSLNQEFKIRRKDFWKGEK